MNTARPRLAVLAGGLALTTVAAMPVPTFADDPVSGNQHVVLYHPSDKQGDGKSSLNGTAQVLSHDGRKVVFSTDAPLVERDRNRRDDVYLRDLDAGVTRLVSVRGGDIGDRASFEPTISADGRFVAFTTAASNLAKDPNGRVRDVLVRDMETGKVQRVSVDSAEKQRDRNSFFPVIAADGRSVSFQTFNAFGPKDKDRREDVYVRDLRRGTTKQVSLLPSGKDVPAHVLNGDISDDGNLVVFGNSDNLWVRDVAAGTTTRFHHEERNAQCQPLEGLSSAGRPAISGDGQYVALSSCSSALPSEDHRVANLYRIHLATGELLQVTSGNNHSYHVSLSQDGQVVGFSSDAGDLVAGDLGTADTFVADLTAGTITRASEAADGTGGNRDSGIYEAAISGDGQSLAYATYADNLVENDIYPEYEVLVWHR